MSSGSGCRFQPKVCSVSLSHHAQVIDRLGENGPLGELLGQAVGVGGKPQRVVGRIVQLVQRRGLVAIGSQFVVRPHVVPGRRAQIRWRRVAEDPQAGGRVDLRALGERADPAVQERAVRLGQRVLAVAGVEPDHVCADRHDARHEQREQAAPADPSDQHGHKDHGKQRLADRPHQGRIADEQAGDRHHQDRRPVVPAQDHHGDGHQEDEQGICGDHDARGAVRRNRTAQAARPAPRPTRAARGGAAARRSRRRSPRPSPPAAAPGDRRCAATAAGRERTGSRSAGSRPVCGRPRRRGSCRSR